MPEKEADSGSIGLIVVPPDETPEQAKARHVEKHLKSAGPAITLLWTLPEVSALTASGPPEALTEARNGGRP